MFHSSAQNPGPDLCFHSAAWTENVFIFQEMTLTFVKVASCCRQRWIFYLNTVNNLTSQEQEFWFSADISLKGSVKKM